MWLRWRVPPIDPLLVLVRLLIRDADQLGQPEHDPSLAHASADMLPFMVLDTHV